MLDERGVVHSVKNDLQTVERHRVCESFLRVLVILIVSDLLASDFSSRERTSADKVEPM